LMVAGYLLLVGEQATAKAKAKAKAKAIDQVVTSFGLHSGLRQGGVALGEVVYSQG
jgi:hypothetical protein